MVEKFVDIEPKYIRLSGVAGQSINTSVRIIPVKKYSFKIIGINAMKGRDIQFSLNEKTFPQGDGYELLVENRKPDQGRYHDVLSLKTDSDIKPVIKVSVHGNIKDPEIDQKTTDSSE